MARISVNSFPVQKLKLSEKNEDWRKDCVDYIIGQMGLSRSGELPTQTDMQINYDLYNSIYSQRDLKYVTNPFNQEDGFPAVPQDVNILRPYVDLLIGEESKRPTNVQVVRTSDQASGELQQKAKQMLEEYIMASIMAQLGPEEQTRYQQALQSGEIATPEQIHKYLTNDYKDIAETTAYHSLKYLERKLNMPNVLLMGWKDGLIVGQEIYYIGIQNGNPVCYRINPMYFWYENLENLDFIHESDKCGYMMSMSVQQLYDIHHDKLTEKQLNELLDKTNQGPRSTGKYGPDKSKVDDGYGINVKRYDTYPKHNPYSNYENVTVYHTCWRSYKKIGFVSILDPQTGEIVEFEVDEFYKPSGYEVSIDWDWIIEIWEGYKADLGASDEEAVYFGIQPLEYQYVRNDDLNSERLPYTGVVYSNTNSKSKSLVSLLKPLQYFFIVIMYRLELALARDKGKIINMDITQIPKSMNIDVSKWLHYLSALGVNLINPYEDGWDIPGREGGKPASFNQITAVDLSMANTINQYVMLMDKIEQMVAQLSGITPQRLGAVTPNELVGNVDTAVAQSANITEPLFWLHNQVKREVYTMLLNTAKYAWSKQDKQYLNYVTDDAMRAFMKLSSDFAYEDFDIFVSDSSRDKAILEQVRQLIQPAMQNGASLVDAIEVLTTDNISMIKSKLEQIEAQRMEMEQQMQERQMQSQEQIAQMQDATKQEELDLKQAELDLKKYQIDTDASVKITVAQLNAYRGTTELDQDGNGIPDPIEIGRNAIAEQKVLADQADKQLQNATKQREIETKKELETKKIDLEKEKLRSAEKIQKMKDQSALEREKLKSRTALKNKTNAEAARGQ